MRNYCTHLIFKREYSFYTSVIIYIAISFLFFNNSIAIYSMDNQLETPIERNYKFTFYYDNTGCLSCKLVALKGYTKSLNKEFPNSEINIIYDGARKSDYNTLKKQFEDFEVIWDTTGNFIKSNEGALSLALQVFDNEGNSLKTFSEIHTNPVNYDDISNLQVVKNLEHSKSLFTISDDLLTRTNSIEFDSEGHILAIDWSSNSLKCIDIQNDSLLYEISSTKEVDTFFIDTNQIKIYKELTDNLNPVSKIRQIYYKNSDEIMLNYSVISEIKIDSTLKFDGTDTILDISKKIHSRGLLYDNNNGKLSMYPHPSNISLSNISFVDNDFYSTISYFKQFNFNDIMNSDTFNVILKSNDPFFKSYSALLTYKQLINEYNLTDFNTRTIGLCHIVDNTNYYYLNPWNNIFLQCENSQFKKINIQGYMTNFVNKNKKKGFRYSMNNLIVKNNKIYILLQEFNKEKRCEKIIVQVYDENKGFDQEYLFSKDDIFFAAFLVSFKDSTYLIFQNKDENWTAIDFFEAIK